jgi:hypothetical protein
MAACLLLVLLPIPGEASAWKGPVYDHIVIVIEENETPLKILGNREIAPFLSMLAENGVSIKNYYGCEHPSQPNYLDLFSGKNQDVHDDYMIARDKRPFKADNLGAQLIRADKTFAGYSEDLPKDGDAETEYAWAPEDAGGTRDYARKHNPWCNWQDDSDPASPHSDSHCLPSTTNRTFKEFKCISDSKDFSQLPTVSIVIPNQQHDDHGLNPYNFKYGEEAQLIYEGDSWLKHNLGDYAKWVSDPRNNSLLIVTFDEDDFTSDNTIPTVFFGAHLTNKPYDAAHDLNTETSLINSDFRPSGAPVYEPRRGASHLNLLRTIEEMYGLPSLVSDTFGPITKVFTITDCKTAK